ncbi:GNAT family N-acetyltransferase [Deltaproteobacteria bacterium OttesenSCG-928-K17]|nr:GNAT family N-acetyltransferase [Deltaproteobacteria bacterium OttesenSCG-928-K17]
MRIVKAAEKDYPRLAEIWASAVLATHSFLPPDYFEQIRENLCPAYFPGVDQLLMALDGDGRPQAFIGLVAPKPQRGNASPRIDGDLNGAAGNGLNGPAALEESPARVEMLFVDAASFGRGYGRALIEKAGDLYGSLELEVNEQNPGGRAFYEKMGFKVTERFETDGEGKPYPLLRMLRRQT